MQIKAGFCLFAATFENALQIAVGVKIIVPRDFRIAFTLQMFLRGQSLSVREICSLVLVNKVVILTVLSQ